MLKLLSLPVLIFLVAGCHSPTELELVSNCAVSAQRVLDSVPESEVETREQLEDYLTYLRQRRRLLLGENLVETPYAITHGYLFSGLKPYALESQRTE